MELIPREYFGGLGICDLSLDVSELYSLFAPPSHWGHDRVARGIVLELASDVLSIPTEERRVTLVEFYCADEVFTTGTMGEVSLSLLCPRLDTLIWR